MGFAIAAMGAGQASAALMDGLVKGVAQGAMNAMAGMAVPSGGGGMPPGAGMDPSATAAMQGGQAGSDPIGDFFDDMFSDGPDTPDQSFLGASGGGPMPGADMAGGAGAQGLPPVVPGPNGQPMLMTDKGALPLVMTQQGPMAVTPRGAIPLQALAAASPQVRQALAGVAAQRMAMASPPPSSTLSGASDFAPAKKAPVALSAPVAPISVPAVQALTAPTTAKADPKLQVTGGGGTRIGTTGTGDGN